MTMRLYNLEDFWEDLSKWSQKTFGEDNVRGPIGALKHLREEIQEVLQSPYDKEEYADCVFLIFDAARRAGITYKELTNSIWDKLQKNKNRKWPPVPAADDGVPRKHIKE